MAVAHNEHTGSLDVLKDNVEEFRRFRSKSPIRRHGKKLELIQTQITQMPMLRAEVGMRMRCANKASAE